MAERKCVLLIVEDDRIHSFIMQQVLGELGVEVLEAQEGQEALQHLEKKPVDLVIMDIKLAGDLDGWEVAKRIRQEEKYSKVPILAVTAHAFDEDRMKSLEAQIDEHVAKPFDHEKFRSLVARYLLDSDCTSNEVKEWAERQLVPSSSKAKLKH